MSAEFLRLIKPILILLLLSTLIASCASPRKAYNRGDYDRAVTMSIDKLRSKPGNRSARDVLSKAWPRAIEYHESQIAMYAASADRFKWERVVTSYEQLNRMASLARRCPACDGLIDTRSLFIDELNEARDRAAEARYLAGLESMRTQSRVNAREAVEHFMVVERMVPDFRDTRTKMTEALHLATLHVVVHVPEIQSRALSISHEFFQNKIMEYLQSNRRMNEFVRFYYPHEARNEHLETIDQEVWLQFDEFSVGQTLLESHTETVTSRDSVKIGETKGSDGRTIDVKGKVEARFTRFKKTVVSGGILDMQVVDAHSGRIILQEKIPGEFVWIHEWGTYNGDSRALNSRQAELAKLRDIPPPPPQDLFVAFTGPIYEQVTSRLRRFYTSY